MTLTILTSYAPSICNFRVTLIKTLVQQNVTVYVIAPDYCEEIKGRVIELGAIPVDCELGRTRLSLFHNFFGLISLIRILWKLKPDVLLSYFIKPVIFGSIAAACVRTSKIVALIEGLGYVYTPSTQKMPIKRVFLMYFVSTLFKISLFFSHVVIFLNLDDQNEFCQKGLVSHKKVFNLDGIGVDLEQWRYCVPSIEPIIFLMAARLLREKGVLEFLEAASIVKNKYEKVRFVIIGDTDDNLGSLSANVLLPYIKNGVIEWPGHVEPKFWMSSCSVFVLPSYREGLPRSTQEAMAIGRAVITTDAPGCRETVIDGYNGFLVPVRDSVALSNAMLRFVENPELIRLMGVRSRAISEERFNVHVKDNALIELMFS